MSEIEKLKQQVAIYKKLYEDKTAEFEALKNKEDINYLDGIHHKDLVEASIGQIIKEPDECWFEALECTLIVKGFIHEKGQVIEGTEIVNELGKEVNGHYPDFLTLKLVADYIEKHKDTIISPMLICESPLSGVIYRYDNYGNGEWQLVGTMLGYA